MAKNHQFPPIFAYLAVVVFLFAARESQAATAAGNENRPVTILAAGDIANCEKSLYKRFITWVRGEDRYFGTKLTAELLDRLPGPILALGDLAYPNGTAGNFGDCFEPAWGRFRDRILPVPGNHEYRSEGAAPYYSYWGSRAGDEGRGYYSVEIGAWHLVALNSQITGRKQRMQEDWLRNDLAKTTARCILAFWHKPLFSSGSDGGEPRMAGVFSILYDAGASVVLAAHDHNYERFAQLAPDGRIDFKRGIRSFTVGTGGHSLNDQDHSARPGSEVFHNKSWGLLKMELHQDHYTWEFVPVAGHRFNDRGAGRCVERSLSGHESALNTQ